MPISKLKASSIASGTIDNARISLDAAEIPALPTSKITSGTFDDARIAASNVSQHATSFDDNKLVNDLSTLGLRVHTQENLNASNTNSASFDVFQDSSGITNLTNVIRNDAEYISSVSSGLATSFTNLNLNQNPYIQSSDVTGGNEDIFTSSDALAGNLGSGAYIELGSSGNDLIRSVYAPSHMGANFQWDKDWELIITGYNMEQQFHGIQSSSGINNLTDESGTTDSIRSMSGLGSHAATSGNFFVWMNAGYTGADGFQPRGSSSTTVIDQFEYANPNGITTRWVHDASAGTIKAQAIQRNSSTYLSNSGGSALVSIGDTSQGDGTGRKKPTSGYPRFVFGHHNQAGTAKFQVWHKLIVDNTNATGSFESNAITASSSTNKMGAVITYQDHAGTNTLNTDIILKLSADNGSNYSTATLTALPNFATGIKMAKVNDLSVTAGTQLKYKLEFANQASGSKEARIRGVSLQY